MSHSIDLIFDFSSLSVHSYLESWLVVDWSLWWREATYSSDFSTSLRSHHELSGTYSLTSENGSKVSMRWNTGYSPVCQRSNGNDPLRDWSETKSDFTRTSELPTPIQAMQFRCSFSHIHFRLVSSAVMNQPRRAVNSTCRFLSVKSDVENHVHASADSLMSKAMILFSNGDLDQSLSLYTRSIEIKPSSTAFHNAATIYYQKGIECCGRTFASPSRLNETLNICGEINRGR